MNRIFREITRRGAFVDSGLHPSPDAGSSRPFPIDSMEWYYSNNSVQHGPVNLETLRGLVANGTIASDELVWHDGMPDWTPVAQIADLAPAVPTADPTPYAPPAAAGTSAYPPLANTRPTSGMAIASLVCGILGITTCTFFPGVLAVVLGHMAMRRTDPANGDLGGRGLVVAGLILGYISVAFLVIFGLMFIAALFSVSSFPG